MRLTSHGSRPCIRSLPYFSGKPLTSFGLIHIKALTPGFQDPWDLSRSAQFCPTPPLLLLYPHHPSDSSAAPLKFFVESGAVHDGCPWSDAVAEPLKHGRCQTGRTVRAETQTRFHGLRVKKLINIFTSPSRPNSQFLIHYTEFQQNT